MSATPAIKRTSEVSTALKRIRLRAQQPQIAKAIEDEFHVHEITSRVLAARGFKPDKVLKDYITPTLKEGLPDPSELKNLNAACELIKEVLSEGGAVGVCSDFDVDGLSGGAQVYHFFKTLKVRTEAFVPDRFTDGYGLNERIVRLAAEKNISLLISVDYGTTNIKEVELARSLGIKTIVVDHHHVGAEYAKPDVFVNPNQEGCGFAGKVMCAAGLAWYLLVGLRRTLPQAKDIDVRTYLDLACLGTICDMVPLIGVNRIIAKKGLEALSQSKRPGMVALKNVIGAKAVVNCHDVGFGIGPRLNAAGRMVHGELVIELLSTDNTDLASKLASRLNRLNADRQDTENIVKQRAIQMVEERGVLESGIVVWDKDFHTGVIGIVAQRLVENFYRPSVVMGVDSDGAYKGSVRGIKGFSVVEALTSVSHLLLKYGGHEGAGGLSLLPENLDAFVAAFVAECDKRLKSIETHPYVEADTEVCLDDLRVGLADELSSFSPFGMGNPVPVLLSRKLKVLDVKDLKGAHLKVTFSDGTRYLTGMMWRQNHHPALIPGTHVDVAYRLDKNTFNGRLELQGVIQAVEASK